MITCNDEIADKNRISSYPCIFQEDDVAPQLSAISLQQWESQVDDNVSSAYIAPTIQSSINDQDSDFANACCKKVTS